MKLNDKLENPIKDILDRLIIKCENFKITIGNDLINLSTKDITKLTDNEIICKNNITYPLVNINKIDRPSPIFGYVEEYKC